MKAQKYLGLAIDELKWEEENKRIINVHRTMSRDENQKYLNMLLDTYEDVEF